MNLETALTTGDLHLRPATLDLNKMILDTILMQVIERKPSVLIINGDVFHTKNETYEVVKHQFRTFLREVTKYTQVIILVGNHDWAREHTIHSLEDFALIPGVKVVDGNHKIGKIGFMAYARSEERFEEMMAPIRDCELIFGHFAVNEFDLGSGYEEVDLWCSPDKFTGIKQIISGHWHKCQKKTIAGVEFLYVGSPATVDQGEANQKKYFAMVNLKDYSYELVETGLTLHKSIKINAGDEWPEVPQADIEKRVAYRVIVRGTKEQLAQLKIPKGYYPQVDTDIIATTERREVIDAYSGASAIIDSYINKKKAALRANLIVRGILQENSTDEEFNRIVERLTQHGKTLAA